MSYCVFEVSWAEGAKDSNWLIKSSTCSFCSSTGGSLLASLGNAKNGRPWLSLPILPFGKVINPKYSKHLPYTVAHTIDCVKC